MPADIPADSVGQPIFTVEQLSKRFNVSTKTIARWRQQGLVSRRFIFAGTAKRIGFCKVASTNLPRITATRSPAANGLASLILKRKMRLSSVPGVWRGWRVPSGSGPPHRRTRQSTCIETFRYIIRQFDEKYPEAAIFPSQTGPLNLEIKERIFMDFLGRHSAETIGKRYCRTRNTVYRVVNEMRAKAIMELPLDYVDSPEFSSQSGDKKILEAEMPIPDTVTRKVRTPSGLPRYLASLYEVPTVDSRARSVFVPQVQLLEVSSVQVA